MALSEVDAVEFGVTASLNRYCAGIVFRVKQYPDIELVQASGTPVRFLHNGRMLSAFMLPARVLEGRGSVIEMVSIGAAADMSAGVIWHVERRPRKHEYIPLQPGVDYVACPDYKPNAPHRKQCDWMAWIVDPAWESKSITLDDGLGSVRYALGGAQGFFQFADVNTAIPPAPPLAPGQLTCKILGFEEVSPIGPNPLRYSMGKRLDNAWMALLGGRSPNSRLMQRRLMVFTATLEGSWDAANAMLTAAGGPGARGLPLSERQFAPEPASMLTWPSRMIQGVRKAAREASLEPLQGAGCKPAFADRQQVPVGIDLLVAGAGAPAGGQSEPGKGWEGGPWLDDGQAIPRIMAMHIGTYLGMPHLYFGRCLGGLKEAAELLNAANPNAI